MVSPSARADSGSLPGVRRRSASPGGAFGASRVLMRSSARYRAVDAGVAGDGSGVIVAQGRRRVRAVAFDRTGRLDRPQALSAPGARADFAASAVAASGAAVVVWFRHRGARWRLEAATREPNGARFGPSQPLSRFVRRPCCTTVSVSIGARGDAAATWTSTARPAVWAALRGAARRFGAPRLLARDASDAPGVVVGDGGAVAILYSTQHVPLRPADGLQLRRASAAGAFGPAEHVNPDGGVTIAGAAVTPAGRVLLAWRDQVHGPRVHLSEAAPGQPLAAVGELGADVSARPIAVAAADDGRAVVAWSQRVSGRREQAFAALRPAPAATAAFATPVALGTARPAATIVLARLLPGAGALVAWNGARFGPPAQRRSALLVTRLP